MLRSLFVALSAPLLLSAFTPAFGAKFKVVSEMTSKDAQGLFEVVDEIVENPNTFGDVSMVSAYSFTKKKSEEDLNTVKQLNHIHAGLNSDDIGAAALDEDPVEDLADHLLAADSAPENEKAYAAAKAQLVKALKAVKTDKNLKIFGTQHSDEDGTWQVLDIFDAENQEVLFIKIGYSGT